MMTTFCVEDVVKCERNDVSVKEGGRFLTHTLVPFGSAFGLAAMLEREREREREKWRGIYRI